LVSQYRLEVIVPLDVEEGDALVASLETDRAESDFEEGGEIVSVGGELGRRLRVEHRTKEP
jgi:hypothetical protein